MHLLQSAKETENKLRWDAYIDKVKFSLYIPKWRVPEPWPEPILVGVTDQLIRYEYYKPLNPVIIEDKLDLRERPILAIINWTSDHTETVRFSPSGDLINWEVGEPYIPYLLLPDEPSKALLVEVKWELD